MFQKGSSLGQENKGLLSCVFQKLIFFKLFFFLHSSEWQKKPLMANSPTPPSIFQMRYIYQSEHLKSVQDCFTHVTSPIDFSFLEKKTSLPTIFKHSQKCILREAESADTQKLPHLP